MGGMIMNKFNELFKSRKFIFLFSAVINIVFILLFTFCFGSQYLHNDVIIIPVLGLLFGPYAVLGCAIVQIGYFLTIYSITEFQGILFSAFILFILSTFLWKLWYSVLNKHGYDVPNLSSSYNFIKFFLIFTVFFIVSIFLYGLNVVSLDEDVAYILAGAGLFIALIAMYLCNYFKIPLYSPRIQFKKVFPVKIYDVLLILLIVVGLLYGFCIVDYNPRWLMLILLLIYLFKPYNPDVFKIENKFDINIPFKLIFSLLLVLFTFLIIVVAVSFILWGYGNYGVADFIVWVLADYMIVLIALFAIPAYVYMYFLEKNVTTPVNKISHSLSAEISSSEDYNQIRDTLNSINAANEINALSDSLLDMESDLMEYSEDLVKVTAENERFKAELDFAENIQSSMVPTDFDTFCDGKNFKISGLMKPAREVGGDFYDYFEIDEDNIGFVIGDVSGKGIPAALIMVEVMTLIQDYTKYYDDLSEVFFAINNLLCEGGSEKLPVNCWLAKLNIKTGELNFVNADHKQPLIKQNHGSFKFLNTAPDLDLARIKDTEYKSHSIQLNSGDELFLYVDGITEAKDASGKDYGEDRLVDVLNSYSEDDLNKLINHIKNDVDAFSKDSEQYDDITMFVIRYE